MNGRPLTGKAVFGERIANAKSAALPSNFPTCSFPNLDALEEQVAELIMKRHLIRAPEDWCPPFPGFFLYYPSRRNQLAALVALINALRLS